MRLNYYYTSIVAMYLIHPDSHDMEDIDQSQKGGIGGGGGGNYLHHLLLDPILDVHLGSSNCMDCGVWIVVPFAAWFWWKM